MITVEKYTEITKEVINLIENALYQLFIKKPEDYVLFMASGEYNNQIAQNKTLNLSPYTISGHNLDNYFDYSRLKFLCDFLNKHYSFMDGKELIDDEYRMNIEFLVYTHIWEARPFLKKLFRLANLLCGEEYDWKIKVPEYGKSKFINDKISKPFNNSKCLLGNIIANNYNSDLRNAIAHSDYQIDEKSKKIEYRSKKALRSTSFDDWSIHFAYSVSLSYYFTHIVNERRKRIIQDWGKNYFTIKMPFSDGSIKHVCLLYDVKRDDFDFIREANTI